MKCLIYGATGFGEEIAKTFSYLSKEDSSSFIEFVGFIDDDLSKKGNKIVGLSIVGNLKDAIAEFKDTFQVVLAIGNTKVKKDLAKRLTDNNILSPCLLHKDSTIIEKGKFEAGTIIMPQSFVSADVHIGKHSFIGSCSTIGHNSTIGEFCTVNPGTKIAGHTEVGDKVYFGIGATLIDRISIGNDVTVGAGAVVIGDVDNSKTVVGVPAKTI